jgi:DNA (cytosine-5)-methyltransferase 1
MARVDKEQVIKPRTPSIIQIVSTEQSPPKNKAIYNLKSNNISIANKNWSLISLFSGCGGLDLGFRGNFKYNGINHKRLPYNILGAYDHDPKCVATYNQNIVAHAEVLDLSTYDPKAVPSANVVIGGFPCQDFASCGPRKGLDSERGRLYKALIKYAQYHKPLAIIGENVLGLANIAKGEILQTIVKEIESIGYKVKVWTLYAPEYGIPQNRTRLFIIGIRKDLDGFPDYPQPTHEKNYRNIKWAIQDLEGIKDDSIPNQSQYFLASKAKKGNGQGDETSRAEEPSYTVRANAKSRVQFHYSLDRRLTVRECARLQTFPDDFVFPFSATTNIMQIGNAVPPMLGHVIASSLADWLQGLEE